jgi:beta-glucosidase
MGLVKMPITAEFEDVAAARRATLAVTDEGLFNNAWWMDPVLLGSYPEEGLQLYGDCSPEIHDGDMEEIHQPLDFLGVNTYAGEVVRAGQEGKAEALPREVGHRATAYRWPVTPAALYWGPKFLYERYQVPIYVTENGMSNVDWVALDGRVHDPQRIDFMQRYLLELGKAVDAGIDVRGYFYWSVLDNFEWAEGYAERFGLIHVDYTTQRRTPKDSARWYSEVIASHGEVLNTPYMPDTPARETSGVQMESGTDWSGRTTKAAHP